MNGSSSVNNEGDEFIAAWSGHTLEGIRVPSVVVPAGQLPEALAHGFRV